MKLADMVKSTGYVAPVRGSGGSRDATVKRNAALTVLYFTALCAAIEKGTTEFFFYVDNAQGIKDGWLKVTGITTTHLSEWADATPGVTLVESMPKVQGKGDDRQVLGRFVVAKGSPTDFVKLLKPPAKSAK